MNIEEFDNLKKYFTSNYEFFIDIDPTLFKTMKNIESISEELDLKINSFQTDLLKAAGISNHNNNGIIGGMKNRKKVIRVRETGF